MTINRITALPTPPVKADADFNNRADGFVTALPVFAAEANALADSISTRTVTVTASRTLTAADDGAILNVTTTGLTLTVPATGLPDTFGIAVAPPGGGTVTIAAASGATINGGTASLSRASSSNAMFLVQRLGATAEHRVTGT